MKKDKTSCSLTGVFDMLDQIARSFDQKTSAPVLNQLQSARSRYEDSYLNMAVIGDFSCGKSTFINALLERDVLATDMRPTTAIPTYIRWNADGGDIDITAYGNNGKAYMLSSSESKKEFELYTNTKLPASGDAMADAVTTDSKLCKTIEKICLSVPKNKRFNGICLIDTPGVNPGTTGTAGHVQITQDVLRKAADAAIIMFPADRVYTRDFQVFLTDNATHLLGHSIFVMTKCDIIRKENELPELTEFVKGHLSLLGVDHPVIHCISAGCALSAYLGMDMTATTEAWRVGFENTTAAFFGELASKRKSIVQQNVSSVIDQVMKRLTVEVQKRTDVLARARAQMEAYSADNMNAECEAFIADFIEQADKLEQSYADVANDVVSNALRRCRAVAYWRISNEKTKEGVSNYLKQYTTKDLSSVETAIEENLREFSSALESKWQKCKEQIEDCLNRYHIGVSVAAVNALCESNEKSPATAGISAKISGFITGIAVLNASIEIIEDIAESDSFIEGALKTALGVILFPFALGGMLYNWFRSLDAIQSEAKERVSQMLESNCASLCESLTKGIATLGSNYKTAAKKLPNALKSMYAVEYEVAQTEFEKQQHTIQDQMEQQKTYLAQLTQVSKQLNAM